MKKLLLLVLSLVLLVAATVLVGAVAGPWLDRLVASWSPTVRFWILLICLLVLILGLPLYAATELYFSRVDRGKEPSWINCFALASLLVAALASGAALVVAPEPPAQLLRERTTYLPRLLADRLLGPGMSVPDAATFTRLTAQQGEDGAAELKAILAAILEQDQFSVSLGLEVHPAHAGEDPPRELGTGLVALDLRGGDAANQRLELHLRGGEPPERLDAVLVVRRLQAFFWLQQPSQEPVAARLDLEPLLAGASGRAGGLGLTEQLLGPVRDDLQRLKQDPRGELARQGTSRGTARLIEPHILLLRSRDDTTPTLLYFDRATHLPRFFVTQGERQQQLLVLQLRHWKRGVQVDASLPVEEAQYQDLNRLLLMKLGHKLQEVGEVLQRLGQALAQPPRP